MRYKNSHLRLPHKSKKKVAWALLISCLVRCSKPSSASTANAHATWLHGRFAYTLATLIFTFERLTKVASCIAKTLLKIYILILLLFLYQ